MQPRLNANPASLAAMKLVDFGQLQARYQAQSLTMRAEAVLEDAEPAMKTAERILSMLAGHPQIEQAFASVRKNAFLTGRMRPSEAKMLLMDASGDFIEGTRHKLAAWCKTMQRLAQGEDIARNGSNKEYIPAQAPLALAIAGSSGISNFLSVLQLSLAELAKLDGKNAAAHAAHVAELRRCATLLADCEHASGIHAAVQ